jgi:hypothetical protein
VEATTSVCQAVNGAVTSEEGLQGNTKDRSNPDFSCVAIGIKFESSNSQRQRAQLLILSRLKPRLNKMDASAAKLTNAGNGTSLSQI